MKYLLRLFKTTFIGGFLFLLPLVLSVLLLREVVQWLGKILEPTVRFLALHSVLGVHAQYILAALLLFLFCFLAGLLARTGAGSLVRGGLENLILRKMPGYSLLKGLSGAESGRAKDDFEAALVRIAPGKFQMTFIVERHADGWLTIFIPSAPNPTSGTVQMVAPEHVVKLAIPAKQLAMCLMKIGDGFEGLAGTEAKRGD
ncbi:MAG TPA: DUF502 domain-containing protein [bacterium]|nr:DUF502 domain-containing protein [bacterium]